MKKRLLKMVRFLKHRLLFDPRRIDTIANRVDYIVEFLKQTTDITKVPAAKGVHRMAQLANAYFLKRVTDVLDKNKIPYWLSYGTLLGAVRHGGAVPWDDDIDIGVLRSDHNRLVDILNREFAGEENFLVVKSDALRVMLTDSSCQIDIFAFDEYHVAENEVERLKREYTEVNHSVQRDMSRLAKRERTIVNYTDEEILSLQRKLASRFTGDMHVLMLGIETGTSHPPVWNHDWVFPLRRMTYEGMEFFGPNKAANLLFDEYGDFMRFPGSWQVHGDIESRLTLDAYQKFEKILADNNVGV